MVVKRWRPCKGNNSVRTYQENDIRKSYVRMQGDDGEGKKKSIKRE